MKQITIVHDVHCAPDRFWRLFFEPAFNAALYRDALRVQDFTVLDYGESAEEIRRTITGRPTIEIPAAARKFVGDRLSFTESGRFDRRAQTWRFDFTTSAFGDKVRSAGTIRLEPAGEGRVRRIGECTLEAKVFGVGGMIEGAMESSLRDTWAAGARFTNDWLARGGAG